MPCSFPTILRFFHAVCLAGAGLLLVACRESRPADPPAVSAVVPVRVGADGMTRGGKPYFVKGAGGSGCMEQLAARGGNSFRTWTTNGLGEILDQAGKLGLTVSAGIWLEQESSWFSYQNPEHCDKQAERVRKEVMAFRDHPALLAWGIGNEVEGDGANIAFWRQLDRLARMVKELDPAHPTFTAVAGVNKAKVEGLMSHAPHLDYLGVNTYQAVFSLRKQLADLGWNRPWMLTEWGPRGFWESPKGPAGAPVEQTSSEKAAMIGRAYQAAVFPGGGCLGSYVFVWGWKFEASATWFGIFTHEGESTAVADTLQEMWSGSKPANRAPGIGRLRGVPKSAVAAGESFQAHTEASDPDGDPLDWHWAVLPEQRKHDAHKRLPMPDAVPGAVVSDEGPAAEVKAPAKPGIYRLHVWVKDGKGHAATANMPFEVR